MKLPYLFGLLLFLHSYTHAQNNRLNTYESIGWYNYFGTIQLAKNVGLHTEYQWRRNHLITDWQQSLLRLGLNYAITPNVLFRVGYAWIETFPYGEIPINAFGRDFTEHRLFEMIQLVHKEHPIEFSHRFMLEQRWIGRYSNPTLKKEDDFLLMHRIRYMFRLQIPLRKQETSHNIPYVAFYDELFVGFGKNVNANVFDQNRLGILIGYRWNKHVRLEAGYLNQILQFGRQINGKNVFQYNNGLIVNAYINLP